MTAWRKAGHRSVLHRGYPRLVVRFNPKGKGTAKLLCNPQEFAQSEMAAGRVPEKTIETLVKDAERAWLELQPKIGGCDHEWRRLKVVTTTNFKIIVNKKKMLALLRRLQWSARERGQGNGFMGSGNDGPLVRACPICGGIDPSDPLRGEFTHEAHGHQGRCSLWLAIRDLLPLPPR